MKQTYFIVIGLLVLLIVCACSQAAQSPASLSVPSAPVITPSTSVTRPTQPLPSTIEAVPTCTYQVVRSYPHDKAAFTQGLVYENGVLYEGTGRYGQSSIRKVELETGRVLQVFNLPAEYFGEGITIYQDKIIQLTWKNQTGFVYDLESFSLLRDFTYPSEGWGLTHDGKNLIMSDGTSKLHFLDPETFAETGSVEVKDRGSPVVYLNELEYIKGQIYANIWQTDKIAIIDPQNGNITAWIDLTGIIKPGDYTDNIDVLNGIAYDAASDRLWVTGKLWPRLFEIRLN
jgi:glutaminyl-peptide cyclotransferase